MNFDDPIEKELKNKENDFIETFMKMKSNSVKNETMLF